MKMKPQELRLGNLVNDHLEGKGEDEDIGLHPIPITEEELELNEEIDSPITSDISNKEINPKGV